MWRWSRFIRCASRFCTIYRYRWADSLNDKTFSTGHISLDSISQTQYLFRPVRLAPRQKQEARRAKAKPKAKVQAGLRILLIYTGLLIIWFNSNSWWFSRFSISAFIIRFASWPGAKPVIANWSWQSCQLEFAMELPTWRVANWSWQCGLATGAGIPPTLFGRLPTEAWQSANWSWQYSCRFASWNWQSRWWIGNQRWQSVNAIWRIAN